jgi:GT2 family glycosyltransferase
MKNEISSDDLKKIGSTVCAVLVTFNRVELLKLAINSLYAQTVSVGSICVVNNASIDETKDYLDSDTNIQPIHLSENTGGAGGFYTGIKHAAKCGYKYFWIMDDDAIADPGALEALLTAHTKLDGDYGFLCSNVQSTDGFSMNVPDIDFSTNSTGYSDWPAKIVDLLVPVRSSTFVSCFIPSDVVYQVGLPIKQMFIWGDDTEFTRRISKDRRSFFVANSLAIHKRVDKSALNILSEGSLARISMYRFLYRNSVYLRMRYESKRALLKYLFHCGIQLVRVILFSKDNRKARAKAIAGGLISAFFFRPKIEMP